jgi:hypothetical protein
MSGTAKPTPELRYLYDNAIAREKRLPKPLAKRSIYGREFSLGQMQWQNWPLRQIHIDFVSKK